MKKMPYLCTYLLFLMIEVHIGGHSWVVEDNTAKMPENEVKVLSTSFHYTESSSTPLNTAANRHLSFMRPEAQNNSQITAQLGGKAIISCYTLFLGDHLVIWLKRDEERLLTAGKQVYSSEGRYSIAHVRHQKLWELTIREVRWADEGLYECQLTAHPPVSLFFWLKIIEARAVIRGRKEMYVRRGGNIRLLCHVEDATESIFFVFWFHNDSMINYKSRKDISIKKQHYGSILTIESVTQRDAGVYRCEPYLARPDNVTLHVLRDGNGYIGRPFFNDCGTCLKTKPGSFLYVSITLFHLIKC